MDTPEIVLTLVGPFWLPRPRGETAEVRGEKVFTNNDVRRGKPVPPLIRPSATFSPRGRRIAVLM